MPELPRQSDRGPVLAALKVLSDAELEELAREVGREGLRRGWDSYWLDDVVYQRDD